VKCWGANNLGQLGDSTATDRTTPVNVTWLSGGVAVISAGYEHTGALTVGGGVKSWGFNNRGQLGDGTTTNSNTAVDVVGLEGSVLVSTSPAVTGLELAWLHMDFSVEHYEVYRSQTTPFFEPGGPDSVKLSPDVPAPTSGTAIEVTFEDAADLTIPGASYYYAVVPVNESGESFATSNPTGAFVYDLMPGGVARR
jgi:hypothetical protein